MGSSHPKRGASHQATKDTKAGSPAAGGTGVPSGPPNSQFHTPLLRQHTTRDEPDTRASHLHGAWAKTNRPMTFLSVPVHFPNEPPLRAQKAHATKEDIQIHINHSYDSSLYIKGASVPCPSYEILTFVLKKNYLREN